SATPRQSSSPGPTAVGDRHARRPGSSLRPRPGRTRRIPDERALAPVHSRRPRRAGSVPDEGPWRADDRRSSVPIASTTDIARMRDNLFFEGPDLSARLSRFWLLLTLAAVIASAGVVADSTATVIGAMIVAPL